MLKLFDEKKRWGVVYDRRWGKSKTLAISRNTADGKSVSIRWLGGNTNWGTFDVEEILLAIAHATMSPEKYKELKEVVKSGER